MKALIGGRLPVKRSTSTVVSCPVQVVPGVSSLMACADVAGAPLAARNDVLTVLREGNAYERATPWRQRRPALVG